MAENRQEQIESASGAVTGLMGGVKGWLILAIAYAILLLATGYIAFFQPAFNPAVEIDTQIEELIADPNTKDFTLEALREEGAAFKARRELAVQSFNVVLGASLGFLSALATIAIRRR